MSLTIEAVVLAFPTVKLTVAGPLSTCAVAVLAGGLTKVAVNVAVACRSLESSPASRKSRLPSAVHYGRPIRASRLPGATAPPAEFIRNVAVNDVDCPTTGSMFLPSGEAQPRVEINRAAGHCPTVLHGAALGPVLQPHQLFSTFAVPPRVTKPVNPPPVLPTMREKLILRTFPVVIVPTSIAPPFVPAEFPTIVALLTLTEALTTSDEIPPPNLVAVLLLMIIGAFKTKPRLVRIPPPSVLAAVVELFVNVTPVKVELPALAEVTGSMNKPPPLFLLILPLKTTLVIENGVFPNLNAAADRHVVAAIGAVAVLFDTVEFVIVTEPPP